jgi:hypothetical protein
MAPGNGARGIGAIGNGNSGVHQRRDGIGVVAKKLGLFSWLHRHE